MVLAASLMVFIAVFAAAAAAVIGGAAALEGIGGRRKDDAGAGGVTADDLVRSPAASSFSFWAGVLERFDLVERFRTQLAQAGLGWSPGRLTMLMCLSGLVALVLVLQVPFLPAWTAILAGCAGLVAPYGFVRSRRSRRFRKIEEQLPDALDSLARALRAGHPVTASLDLLSRETPEPLSGELRRLIAEIRLGMPVETALEKLAVRVPVLEIGTFAAATRLQLRSGGRLGEVLERLGESMRESNALRGEVRAISAHGRMTGWVLSLLPLFIAAVMMYVSPGYLAVLVNYEHGKDLIAAAAGCLVLAHFVIRRIVDVRL